MAVNLALGVQYAAGVIPVHRNFVALKPKPTTMASYAANNQNPASKYGALEVAATRRRNLVTRRGQRTTVAVQNPAVESESSAKSEKKTATNIKFENQTGSILSYKDHHFWHGNHDTSSIPKKIEGSQHYTHTADRDDHGSVGGLLYLFEGSVYWVVAWRNRPGSENNQVYTEILSAKTKIDHTKFWDGIYGKLERQSHKSDFNARDLGLYAEINITTGNTPKVTASLRRLLQA